jgi:alkanesulfonate monooxygenase SsuD/methylene tetrahydromethanopterin reductase-like flavin-dependent oxidoreductase (luciferase family)
MTTMRFGLPGGRGDLGAASPDSKLVQAAAADELGYDCLWLSEQHFVPVDAPPGTVPAGESRARYGPSSPIVLAAAIAASTRRIRIGFSPLLVQLHDPVRLAEDIATLDRLSGGRVNLGIGRAGRPMAEAFAPGRQSVRQPTRTAAPQPAPTVADALDAVLGLWAGQPIPVDGTAHCVTPAPAQHPHPPVYVTADTRGDLTGDDRQVKWAADRGYPVIAPAMLPTAAVARFLTGFAGHGGPAAESPVERFCLVADSDAAARELALPLLRQLTDRYARGTSPEPPGLSAGDNLDPERFYAETALVGSPDTVAGRVAELRDQYGVGYINLRPSLTGLCPLVQQRVTVALFAAEVMPRFRQASPAGALESDTRP